MPDIHHLKGEIHFSGSGLKTTIPQVITGSPISSEKLLTFSVTFSPENVKYLSTV